MVQSGKREQSSAILVQVIIRFETIQRFLPVLLLPIIKKSGEEGTLCDKLQLAMKEMGTFLPIPGDVTDC